MEVQCLLEVEAGRTFGEPSPCKGTPAAALSSRAGARWVLLRWPRSDKPFSSWMSELYSSSGRRNS